MRMDLLFSGFPGKLSDGYLGWSSVALVRSEGRNILFDTGGFDRRVNLCPAIEATGLKPDDIHIVVCSHFHADHVNNLDYFTKAEVLLHEDEIPYARKGQDPWQPPCMLEPLEKSGRLRGVKEGERLASGVSVIHLPGHTPGCMGLLLEDEGMPPTVLAGDAVKNLAEMASGAVAMTREPERTYASIKKVKSFAEQVVPGHDRLLRIERDRVVALQPSRRTLVVPAGVVDQEPRKLELTLEQSWLPFSNGL
jgi:glyoxylase-like metal-dependent hydrolase (beta-lactamase superfamily II)